MLSSLHSELFASYCLPPACSAKVPSRGGMIMKSLLLIAATLFVYYLAIFHRFLFLGELFARAGCLVPGFWWWFSRRLVEG